MQITHSTIWKKSPDEKTIMVSDFVRHTLPMLKKHDVKKILDVACGNGMGVSLPLAKLSYEVHGFDRTKNGVHACKTNLKFAGFTPHLRKADMYKKFPYMDSLFDAAYCFQAIYHGRLENIMYAISEIKRVLKPGMPFFTTFQRYEDIYYDAKKKKHYMNVKYKGRRFRSYLKQDAVQPHLFYYLSKEWEYMVPHYFFAKDELRCILKQYFSQIRIIDIGRDDVNRFWLAHGMKK